MRSKRTKYIYTDRIILGASPKKEIRIQYGKAVCGVPSFRATGLFGSADIACPLSKNTVGHSIDCVLLQELRAHTPLYIFSFTDVLRNYLILTQETHSADSILAYSGRLNALYAQEKKVYLRYVRSRLN